MLSRILFHRTNMKMAPKNMFLAPMLSQPMRLFGSAIVQKDRSDIFIMGNPLVDVSVEVEDDRLLKKYGL